CSARCAHSHFNAPSPLYTYTLSLHDALPISLRQGQVLLPPFLQGRQHDCALYHTFVKIDIEHHPLRTFHKPLTGEQLHDPAESRVRLQTCPVLQMQIQFTVLHIRIHQIFKPHHLPLETHRTLDLKKIII